MQINVIGIGLEDGFVYDEWLEPYRPVFGQVLGKGGLEGRLGWKHMVFAIAGRPTAKIVARKAIKLGAKIWPVHVVLVARSKSWHLAEVSWGLPKPKPEEIREGTGAMIEPADNLNPPASMAHSFNIQRAATVGRPR